jgi:hypothetical protein
MTNDTGSVADQIHALEDERYAAMIAGDADALGRLLSDRLVYRHSTAATTPRPAIWSGSATARSSTSPSSTRRTRSSWRTGPLWFSA